MLRPFRFFYIFKGRLHLIPTEDGIIKFFMQPPPGSVIKNPYTEARTPKSTANAVANALVARHPGSEAKGGQGRSLVRATADRDVPEINVIASSTRNILTAA
jgi:hypothetical protein